MALFASQARVRTGQWEFAAVVIEVNMIPTRGVMTGRTICAKLPVMRVILLVTGETVRRCAFELIIGVTGLTSEIGVPTL